MTSSGTSPNVAFSLVEFQHLLHLGSEFRIDPGKALGDILVDRALRYSEEHGRFPNGVLRPEYVVAHIQNALPNVVLHRWAPFDLMVARYIWAGKPNMTSTPEGVLVWLVICFCRSRPEVGSRVNRGAVKRDLEVQIGRFAGADLADHSPRLDGGVEAHFQLAETSVSRDQSVAVI